MPITIFDLQVLTAYSNTNTLRQSPKSAKIERTYHPHSLTVLPSQQSSEATVRHTIKQVQLIQRFNIINDIIDLFSEPAKVYDYINVMVQNRHVTPQVLRHSKYAEYIDVQKLPVKFRKPRKNPMRAEVKGDSTTNEPERKLSSKELQLFNRIKHHLTNPLLSPLMAPDLGGLPSTLIVLSEFDVLRDDGLLYAHRLRQAGVPIQVYIGRGFHGDFHTYDLFPELLHSRTGQMSVQSVCSYITREA